MLNEQQIQDNKNRFLQLLSQITIEDADTQGLADFLLNSDFFEAPASTKYHCNFKGGLCQHSLNVYDNLCKLVDLYVPGKYSKDTLAIVSLFHDLSKTNFYEVITKNKKVYKLSGRFTDSGGKYDWETENIYAVKDSKDRFLAADHPTNSLLLLQRYIPLNIEEASAIINHHGFTEAMGKNSEISFIFEKYSLALLLHLADLISTYIVEERNE